MLSITQHTIARHEGKDIEEYVLAAPGGFSMAVLNYGGIIMKLNNKPWFFQFSPYLYYPEHSIAINPVHGT